MIIPCRKCNCGLYSDISVAVCDVCGADMRSLPVEMVTFESIGVENMAEVDPSRDYYVRRCEACGKDNYSDAPESARNLCAYCGKPISEVIAVKINKKTGEPQTVASSGFPFKPSSKTSGASMDEILGNIDRKMMAQESQQQSLDVEKAEPKQTARGPKIVGQSGGAFFSGFGEKEKLHASPQSVDVYDWDDEDDTEDTEPWSRVTISGLKAMPTVPVRKTPPKKTAPQKKSHALVETLVERPIPQPVPEPTEHLQPTDQNTVYVQRCEYCGTENFTSDPSSPVMRCTGCGKARLKSAKWVPYKQEPKADSEASTGQAADTAWSSASFTPSEDDVGSFGIVEASPGAAALGGFAEDTDEAKSGNITFTAVRFGSYSFTISEGQSVMLGRRAAHADFLRNDIRVSGNHCTICSGGGKWFVKDNNSENGTFINQRDLGEGGEGELTDGCLLVLGHKPDSMAFAVSIL